VTNSGFDLVTIYLLLVTKTGALHLAVFEQPEVRVFFSNLPMNFESNAPEDETRP